MSQTSSVPNPTRVVTPIARLSYPYLFKPSKPMLDGGVAKFQCELIFPKTADLSELKRAVNQAAVAKWGSSIPKNLKSPFRSGDTDREGKDGYEGSIFIGARSKDKPGVVIGPSRIPCVDESDVYGGCYVICSVTAFAYDTSGNKGVSFALNNVWKVRDGEPFGTRQAADQEFSSVQVDSDAFGDTSFDVDVFG